MLRCSSQVGGPEDVQPKVPVSRRGTPNDAGGEVCKSLNAFNLRSIECEYVIGLQERCSRGKDYAHAKQAPPTMTVPHSPIFTMFPKPLLTVLA
jgi:hypothetical protein